MQFIFLLLLFTILTGIISVWAQTLQRLWQRRTLLAWRPRQPIPWGLADVLFGFFVLLLGQTAAIGLTARLAGFAPGSRLLEMPPRVQAVILMAGSLASLAALLLVVGWLYARYRPRLPIWGLDKRRIATDIALGTRAYLLLAPVVYFIQFLLTQWYDSRHPLTELLRADPSPAFFLLSFFAAVFVAPLAEEFFFRLLLQGWLERLFARDGGGQTVWVGGPPERHVPSMRPSIAPVLGSALAFALLHGWPDQVPLLVLAVGLGMLYQRTQRILPCIVLHLLINASSLVALLMAVYAGE